MKTKRRRKEKNKNKYKQIAEIIIKKMLIFAQNCLKKFKKERFIFRLTITILFILAKQYKSLKITHWIDNYNTRAQIKKLINQFGNKLSLIFNLDSK